MHRVICLGACTLSCLLASFGCGGGATNTPAPLPDSSAGAKKAGELKWAREVAETFLNDVVAGKWPNAAMLLSKGYKNSRWGAGSDAIKSETGGTLDGHKPGEELTAWTIASQQLAPDVDEASFRGELKGPNRTGDFALRVSKEKDSGKWRVEQFSFRPQKK